MPEIPFSTDSLNAALDGMRVELNKVQAALALEKAKSTACLQQLVEQREQLAILASPFVEKVLDERKRQDVLWGGPEHDDTHTNLEWLRFRTNREEHLLRDPDYTVARKSLVAIAALAIAQGESLDRKEYARRRNPG
jgi:hypothetical protein